MAYRKSNGKLSRKNKKRQPAVLEYTIRIPSGQSYLDLALCASIANRRGYKQQDMTWAVSGFELFGSGTGTVSILKLPETWVYENAYKKSKMLWEKMNDQVLDEEPSIPGAYADFKIGMDSDHVLQSIQDSGNESGKILTPYFEDGAGGITWTAADFNGAVAPVADWDFSKIEIPNDGGSGVTVGYTLHAVGANAGASKGLIAGYQMSRSRPNTVDPNVPLTGNWMNTLFDDGEQLREIRDNLEADNDQAPYPIGAEDSADAYYPGGPLEQPGLQIHSFCNFTTTTVSGKNSIMGGLFQNGLMKFINTTGSDVSMVVHMMPGSHRGYFCEEM